ncbi:MAG: mannonate dehydratase [Halopseudomonas aestusnigri]
MIESMRWFGPSDPVSLADIRQSGASSVVTALHEIPVDQAWSKQDVLDRRDMINAAGLEWDVVESIPVHDSIKRFDNEAFGYIKIWIESLRAVANAGITTVCYNFMPVLDWTRTDLDHRLPNGGSALRFDATAFAAFDLYILKRPNADKDFSNSRIEAAKNFYDKLSSEEIGKLSNSVIAGLPGGMTGGHNLDGLRKAIELYQGITHDKLLDNISAFQAAVVREAEELGVLLAIHPDDPPRPLLGLPRAASTRQDFETMFSRVPSISNGLTWCLGSLSAGNPEEAMEIGREQAQRIHFSHLRVVESDEHDLESFQEAEHLGGDVSLVSAIDLLLNEENRRQSYGINQPIPIRPDHGHRILEDLEQETNPGYGAIGRMKGLAELRGVVAGLSYRNERSL